MSPATRSPRPRPPVGQSMALLTELMEHPLDGSYQDRADARVARGEPAATGGRSPLLLVVCVALGLLLAVAAQTLRVPQERASGQRQEIITQIESRQRGNATLARQISGLRSQIATAQEQAVGSPGESTLAEQLARTEASAGAVAVSGPGVVLTLDDSAGAKAADNDPRSAGGASATLTSTDLQILVNGLWQAGAEAISINGHRLTALSAIRFAGAAILVDYRPLARPYAISAIGAPGLWDTFRAGPGGSYLDSTRSQVDLDVKVNVSKKVDIPAADAASLYQAKPRTPASASSSASTSTRKETP